MLKGRFNDIASSYRQDTVVGNERLDGVFLLSALKKDVNGTASDAAVRAAFAARGEGDDARLQAERRRALDGAIKKLRIDIDQWIVALLHR